MSNDDMFRNSLFAVRPFLCMMQEGSAAVDGGAAGGVDSDHGWDQIEQAPILADAEDLRCIPCGDVVQDDEGFASQLHRALPAPKPPSRDEVSKHNLTHWPYRSWCPFCVMGRRNADPHFQAKGADTRNLPLLVLDYAFLRNKEEKILTTILVGKCYPSRQVLACVLDMKDTDYLAINRVAEFIRECGLTTFVWKSDQDKSIRALMNEAVKRSGRSGSMIPEDEDSGPITAVPEASPVGSSASNGRAERAVQMVEDQVRTLKAALEAHIGFQLPCSHPAVRWLVQHAADVINKSAINPSGHTPYEDLHGKKAREGGLSLESKCSTPSPNKGERRWMFAGNSVSSWVTRR